MADPGSILSIIAGAASLASQGVKLIRDLHNILEQYNYADLTITSIETNLETVTWAWSEIQVTLESWSGNSQSDLGFDTNTLNHVSRALRGGRLVIAALQDDLGAFKSTSSSSASNIIMKTGFRNKTKIVWNEKLLKDHQERIRDQVNSMNLLINVLNLSTASIRRVTLNRSLCVLQRSDESAFSIVPSKLSTDVSDRDSRLSISSEVPMAYHELSIDSDLFAARVYKRNYRTALIRDLFRKAKREGSEMQQPPSQPMSSIQQISASEQVLSTNADSIESDIGDMPKFYQCYFCSSSIDVEESLYLDSQGSPICRDCAKSCSACGDKIQGGTVSIEDQNLCSSCYRFRCCDCKKNIHNSGYTRMSQGYFCMDCYNHSKGDEEMKAVKFGFARLVPQERSLSEKSAEHSLQRQRSRKLMLPSLSPPAIEEIPATLGKAQHQTGRPAPTAFHYDNPSNPVKRDTARETLSQSTLQPHYLYYTTPRYQLERKFQQARHGFSQRISTARTFTDPK